MHLEGEEGRCEGGARSFDKGCVVRETGRQGAVAFRTVRVRWRRRCVARLRRGGAGRWARRGFRQSKVPGCLLRLIRRSESANAAPHQAARSRMDAAPSPTNKFTRHGASRDATPHNKPAFHAPGPTEAVLGTPRTDPGRRCRPPGSTPLPQQRAARRARVTGPAPDSLYPPTIPPRTTTTHKQTPACDTPTQTKTHTAMLTGGVLAS
jgi:hypothetical protein